MEEEKTLAGDKNMALMEKELETKYYIMSFNFFDTVFYTMWSTTWLANANANTTLA